MKKVALIIAGMLVLGLMGCNGKASKVNTEPSGDNTVSTDSKCQMIRILKTRK